MPAPTVPVFPPELALPGDWVVRPYMPSLGRPEGALRSRLYRPSRVRPGRQGLSRRAVPRLGRRRRLDHPVVARDGPTRQDFLGSPGGGDDPEFELVVREHGARLGGFGRDGPGLGRGDAADFCGGRTGRGRWRRGRRRHRGWIARRGRQGQARGAAPTRCGGQEQGRQGRRRWARRQGARTRASRSGE